MADLLDVTGAQNGNRAANGAVQPNGGPTVPATETPAESPGTSGTASAEPASSQTSAPGGSTTETVIPGTSNPASSGANGPKVVSPELLMDIADQLTARSDQSVPGLVNINTAGREVLGCLP